MNFLNPALLPLLFLAALPIIIHLLNRLRYRSVRWAAMMFLLKANKSSTRHARLRQYLILACRCCLLFFFLFALARPIIGGWLGMRMAGAPDTVLILLDRSASMEATDPRVQKTKREHAIDLFADAARKGGAASRYVLIENVLKTPQEIGSPEALRDFSLAAPTDTAADIPAMLRAANEYLVNNPEGRTEIWMASDLQASNWHPESKDWERLSAQLAGLPQDVRVRLLALNDTYQDNTGVSLLLARRESAGLELALAMKRLAQNEAEPVPVVFNINGARTQVDVDIDASDFRMNRTLPLSDDQVGGGWGAIELPADENRRDNQAYFVYGENRLLDTTVIADSAATGRYLYLATAPDGKQRQATLVDTTGVSNIAWDAQSLVAWQGSAPEAVAQSAIQRFVESGGVVLVLPPTNNDKIAGPFGIAWSAIENAADEQPFRVIEWEENDGPLARSRNGKNLPVDELEMYKRRGWEEREDAWFVLAKYVDGTPFMLRRQIGKGWVYVLTTLPEREWSLLVRGTVLVPMVQRALQQGAARMTMISSRAAGEWKPDGYHGEEPWISVDAPGAKDPRWDAGVYASGSAKVALNRPVAEDDAVVVEMETLKSMFGDLQVQIMQEDAEGSRDALSSEIWKTFVFVALFFMIGESLLVLSGIRGRAEKTDHGFDRDREAAA